MKKLFKSVLILTTFGFFFGCSSDSSESCEPISCLNGGVSNSDCGCDCPQGFSGTNCNVEIAPAKIKVNEILIKRFPNNAGGLDDLGTNPDLFISLYKSTALIFTSSTYALDANGDGSFVYSETFLSPFECSVSNSIFKLEIWDYDSPPTNNNDLMSTIYFSPYVETEGLGFPTSFNIQDTSGQFKAEVFVTYEW